MEWRVDEDEEVNKVHFAKFVKMNCCGIGFHFRCTKTCASKK